MSVAAEQIVDPRLFSLLCDCRGSHPEVDIGLVSGPAAYRALAGRCAEEYASAGVLLIQDENTRRAAGAGILQELESRGVQPKVLTFPGRVTATEAEVDRVVGAAEQVSLIIAVGAGTINDLGKYGAFQLDLPYWSAPTAPSMNGFTSAIAAIKQAGVKMTLPCRPPRLIFADPALIAAAPLKLRQAGFCDILAKSVSDIDWRIESNLFSGSYCAMPSGLVAGVEELYLNQPEGIGQGDEKTVDGLFKGLLISGIAMAVAGSSAPASGGEHLISHFLDMREPFTGREPELHGLQVAAGIVVSAACYSRLAALESPPAGPAAAEIFDQAAAGLPEIWGPATPEVAKRFRLKKDKLLALTELLPRRWSEIRALCRQVEAPEHYLNLMRRTGRELNLASLRLPAAEFRLAGLTARTIRERITILDLAAQMGVLPEAVERAVELLS